MKPFQPEILEEFLYTAKERHRIYRAKEQGLNRPWTEDPVLQNFFFCNLFRQYDKCSKWIIDNIVPFKRWDLLILYRFISTYETFVAIKEYGIPLDSMVGVREVLREWKSEGKTLFSSCFIRNPRIPGGWTETYNVPFILTEEIKKNGELEEVLSHGSLELTVDFLSQFPGTAGFMGYEYACDFVYAGLLDPKDEMYWANMGPGARKGMSWLVYNHPDVMIHEDDWLHLARELLPIMKKYIEKEFVLEKVTMREVEHWLCEFQKYKKYQLSMTGGRKVKHRKYDGGTDGVQ